jgi:hypothetical protein
LFAHDAIRDEYRPLGVELRQSLIIRNGWDNAEKWRRDGQQVLRVAQVDLALLRVTVSFTLRICVFALESIVRVEMVQIALQDQDGGDLIDDGTMARAGAA